MEERYEVFIMKKLVKKLVVTFLIICSIITIIPVNNVQAASKTYKVVRDKEDKNYYYLVIDIAKTTLKQYLDIIRTYGKKEGKNNYKNQYKIVLSCKCNKKNSDPYKLFNPYAEKMKKYSKYGLTYGLQFDDSQKGTCFKNGILYYENLYTCGQVYYMEKIFEKALTKMKTITVTTYTNKGKTCNTYTANVKDLFPNAKTFKNASDSVKIQFILTYCGKYGMTYGYQERFWTWKDIYEGTAKGDCDQFSRMYCSIARMIGEYYSFGTAYNNHSAGLLYGKNSKGQLDFFETNNDTVQNFAYPLKSTSKKDAYWILDWHHYNVYDLCGDISDKAFKYAKAWKVSELNQLV